MKLLNKNKVKLYVDGLLAAPEIQDQLNKAMKESLINGLSGLRVVVDSDGNITIEAVDMETCLK